MDTELDRRWRHTEPPFDGVTVYTPDLLPLDTLRAVLTTVVGRLEEMRPEARLYRLADWHEHDGWVNAPGASSWEELHRILTSAEALYQSRTQEDIVRLAFYPEERDFLLRLYVPDEEDPVRGYWDSALGRVGDWDFTGVEALASEIAELVWTAHACRVETEPAKGYFDRRYAG